MTALFDDQTANSRITVIAIKTLSNYRSETVGLFRLRLRLDFRWLCLFQRGIWIGIVTVNNCPTHFFCQFFSRLNPDQTLSFTQAAIKLDVAELA